MVRSSIFGRKLVALLGYMLEHAGRLAAKEALLESVWPDVHVTEGNLNRAIAELRDASNDYARAPSLLQTVPRRGYRFIGSVSVVRADDARPLSFLDAMPASPSTPMARSNSKTSAARTARS